MKRKLLGVSLAVVIACALTLSISGLTAPAHAAQFNWKLQSANPAGAPQIVLLKRLADNIETMSEIGRASCRERV